MKYHIGIFGTQMNVCTLIEKNIIDSITKVANKKK